MILILLFKAFSRRTKHTSSFFDRESYVMDCLPFCLVARKIRAKPEAQLQQLYQPYY